MHTSRRSFLKRAVATAVVTPSILPAHIWAADTKPNSRLTMGFIGMGYQMQYLMGTFLPMETQVVAVCDVDGVRRTDAKRRVDEFYSSRAKATSGCAAYNDFRQLIARRDIDAVCIATPDHWHAIPTLAALRSGKDVYCEKPLTHNIHEAVEVLRAVDDNRRVLQTGSMQRSMKEFRVACELVRNGVIGRVKHVACSFGGPPVPCNLPEEPMEAGLDWNLWLGPAPVHVYNSILSPRGVHHHFPNWRSYREFGSGGVGDWGAHHLDIAEWGLGMDQSGPVEILPPVKSGGGASFVYGNGVTLEHKGSQFGVNFFGTEGEVRVDRGRFALSRHGKQIAYHGGEKGEKTSLWVEVQKAEREFLKDPKVKLYVSKHHLADFLDCVKSRKKPITSEQVGARSAICCHLLNQVYFHGQKLVWDPSNFQFVGGTGNPAWLTRDYRKPWTV
jgi:predicted dehydrogenase